MDNGGKRGVPNPPKVIGPNIPIWDNAYKKLNDIYKVFPHDVIPKFGA